MIGLLGTAEEGDVVHIFDVRSMKRLRTLYLPPDAIAKRIVSACFSHDERYVALITGDPDWMMLNYNWERGKIETSAKANYTTNPLYPVREVSRCVLLLLFFFSVFIFG